MRGGVKTTLFFYKEVKIMDAKDIEKLKKQIEDIKNSKEFEKTLDLLKNILDTLDIKTIEKFLELIKSGVEKRSEKENEYLDK